MSKKTRTILFLACLFLFFLTAPLIILYSQGYRFDLNPPVGGIKLTQTGGFGLKAEPKQVEIYIDGKLAKKTDFLFGSALVENLLPKRYKIEVKKEGYLTWEKNLEIKEKEVVEIKNIILFPENIDFVILNKGVEGFWFSPDEKKTIFLETEEGREDWALKLYNLERNIKSHLISEADINQSGANLLNLEFSEDSKEIYLGVETAEASPDSAKKDQEKTFTLKLDEVPPRLAEKEVIPSPENILTSREYNQDVYYLDNTGYVFKNDLRINETPFPVKPEAEYALEIFSDFIFLVAEDQALYWFSQETKSFEIFFDKIKDLKISPDKKKLAFFSSSEVWILFLRDEGVKKTGEKLFLVRLSEKIGDVFWLNSDYLVLNSGNNLKIVEIDDRDRIQTWDIASTQSFNAGGRIYFNGHNKKLYTLSDGNLFTSKKLF
ncbi:MAG TPA: hypothetical protein VMV66_00225 [Candidatus Humimicrobiaceae bacterium]|nr:hypothetical protein [Candidatus Humimicrobiaceae bacterium]